MQGNSACGQLVVSYLSCAAKPLHTLHPAWRQHSCHAAADADLAKQELASGSAPVARGSQTKRRQTQRWALLQEHNGANHCWSAIVALVACPSVAFSAASSALPLRKSLAIPTAASKFGQSVTHAVRASSEPPGRRAHTAWWGNPDEHGDCCGKARCGPTAPKRAVVKQRRGKQPRREPLGCGSGCGSCHCSRRDV